MTKFKFDLQFQKCEYPEITVNIQVKFGANYHHWAIVRQRNHDRRHHFAQSTSVTDMLDSQEAYNCRTWPNRRNKVITHVENAALEMHDAYLVLALTSTCQIL